MEADPLILLPRSCTHLSFDVFDTVVTRCVAEPKAIFAEVEQRLAAEGLAGAANWAVVREQAEFELRRQRDFRVEVTLEGIHHEAVRRHGVPAATAARAQALELVLERQALVPHVALIEAIARRRAEGTVILFVSDIYLPEAFVRALLADLGALHPGDHLFVSSTHGRMKAWGDLFGQVLDTLRCRPEAMCHIGDNANSDVRVPQAMKLRAMHLTRLHPNRYEQPHNGSLVESKLIGAARATRAQNPHPAGRLAEIWDTTANVAAPLLFGFALWCVLRARAAGARRIHFLSRDGQIVRRLAQQICTRFFGAGRDSPGEIDCRYLCVSRQSLLLPGLTALDAEAMRWILARTHGLTLAHVLARLRMRADELTMTAAQRHRLADADAVLDEAGLAVLEDVVRASEHTILASAARHRQVLLAYLDQEGFVDGERPSVIVDIGWNGTLQRALSSALQARGQAHQILGQYFGLQRVPALDPAHNAAAGWFTEPERRSQVEGRTYIVPMLELFTAADHGGVTDYRREQGRVVPQLRAVRNERALQWGLAAQHAAAEAYAAHALRLLRADELDACAHGQLPWLDANLQRFLLEPQRSEAAVYCDFDDAEDQAESFHVKIGRPFSYRELDAFFGSDYMHHHNEWRQGALAITDPAMVDFAWRMRVLKQRP